MVRSEPVRLTPLRETPSTQNQTLPVLTPIKSILTVSSEIPELSEILWGTSSFKPIIAAVKEGEGFTTSLETVPEGLPKETDGVLTQIAPVLKTLIFRCSPERFSTIPLRKRIAEKDATTGESVVPIVRNRT